MQPSLELRMKNFLSALPGAEVIDELKPPPMFEDTRRADYFLSERRVVVELKALTVDTSHKIETEIDRHRDRDEFPVIYGSADAKKVLEHLPDGERIYRRIYGAIT